MATYNQGNVRVAKDGTVTRLPDRRVSNDGTRSLSEDKYQEELAKGRIDPKKFSVGKPSKQEEGDVMDLAQRGLLNTGDKITSAGLAPAGNINLPKPPTPSPLGTQAMTGLAGYASTVGTTTPGGASTETKTPQSADIKAYLKGIAQAPDSEKIYQKTLKESGLQDKQNTVNSLTGQLNAITAKAQADKLSLVGQGRGVPEAIIGGQQAKIDREAAIQSLPISAQLAAAQGDLESARSFMETMFKIRLDDAQSKVDYKNKVNDAVYNYANEQQKLALDERRRMDDRAFGIERDNISYLRDLANTAIENGQPSLAAQLMGLDPASKNFESLVGSYASKIVVDQNSGSSTGTAAERAAGAISTLQSYLSSGQPLKNGNIPVDANGYLTPEAWNMLINVAPTEGLDRKKFIEEFGYRVYQDPDDGISPSYRLTPAEQKLIKGEL